MNSVTQQKRLYKKFYGLHDRLMESIDENMDAFIKERAFLQDTEQPYEVKELKERAETEEQVKKSTETIIETLDLLNKSMPKTEVLTEQKKLNL